MPEKKYVVANYMRPNAPVISLTANLKQAIEKMVEYKTNGLVVVDDNNKVAGIVSGLDIIELIVPDYLEEDKHLASFEAGVVFMDMVKEKATESITKFMTNRKIMTIKPTHTIMEAAALLSEFKIRQLPVVNEKNELVGYINRTDIKNAMADVLEIKR